MRLIPIALAATLLVALLALPALAGPAPQPEQITFQGRLTDASGNPVTGGVEMTFSIYNVASGGTALWWETQTVAVSGGLYSVQLGFTKDFTGLTLDMTNGRWLGIQVTGEASEMSPRYPLTGVPYARRALGADTADDADTLDGLQASAFAQIATPNTFSSTNTFAGQVTFNNLTLRLRSGAGLGTGVTTLVSDALGPRTVRFPDVSGTVVTTANLTDITAVGTVKTGVWEGTGIGVAYGGTGSNSVGEAGAIAYSTGTSYAFLDPSGGGPVLHSGSHGAPPYWDAVNLASATQTTGVLPAARGGTGLVLPGIVGCVLRSNGTAWTASPLLSQDIPAGSGHYLSRDADDTSTASIPGILCEFTNTSESGDPVIALKGCTASSQSPNGTYCGLRGESATGDSTDNGLDVISYGVHGLSTAASRAAGGFTRSHGVSGEATGSSNTGTTLNIGVLGSASGNHGAANHGVHGSATGSTTGTNYGVYGRAANGAVNYAGYFEGDVFTTGDLSPYNLLVRNMLDAKDITVNRDLTVAGDLISLRIDSVSGRVRDALDVDGSLRVSPGSAALPSVSFSSDVDTGWFRPAENELAISTGGTEKVRIPAEGGLTVSGDVRSSGAYAYTTPQSFSLPIPPASLVCEFDKVTHTMRDPYLQLLEVGHVRATAGVQLPQGATVTRVTIYAYDEIDETGFTGIDENLDGSCQLHRRAYLSTTSEVMSNIAFTTSGSSTNIRPYSDESIQSATIDNTTYQYWIRVGISFPVITSFLRGYGCRIDYTIQTLYP